MLTIPEAPAPVLPEREHLCGSGSSQPEAEVPLVVGGLFGGAAQPPVPLTSRKFVVCSQCC